MEKIEEILLKAGFRNINILTEEVSDQYANKWGHGLAIKEYIANGSIMAYK